MAENAASKHVNVRALNLCYHFSALISLDSCLTRIILTSFAETLEIPPSDYNFLVQNRSV